MTPWEALDRDLPFKSFLLIRGWTESKWNKTKKWERGEERVEFNGGLEPDSILSQLPGAIKETVKEQTAAVAKVAGAANRTIQLVAVAAVVIGGAYLATRYIPKAKA